jgi:hypothetical protein
MADFSNNCDSPLRPVPDVLIVRVPASLARAACCATRPARPDPVVAG